jgi:hypothetical protein
LGRYQRNRLNRQGFLRSYLTRLEFHSGFENGDLVCAEVPMGQKMGTHIGCLAVCASGSFNLETPNSVAQRNQLLLTGAKE